MDYFFIGTAIGTIALLQKLSFKFNQNCKIYSLLILTKNRSKFQMLRRKINISLALYLYFFLFSFVSNGIGAVEDKGSGAEEHRKLKDFLSSASMKTGEEVDDTLAALQGIKFK